MQTRTPDVNTFLEVYIQINQHGCCGAGLHVLSSLTLNNVFTCWRKTSSHHIICVFLEPESADISQTNAFSCVAVVQLQLVWRNNSFLGVSCKCTEWLAPVEGLFSRNSWAIIELPITWWSGFYRIIVRICVYLADRLWCSTVSTCGLKLGQELKQKQPSRCLKLGESQRAAAARVRLGNSSFHRSHRVGRTEPKTKGTVYVSSLPDN